MQTQVYLSGFRVPRSARSRNDCELVSRKPYHASKDCRAAIFLFQAAGFVGPRLMARPVDVEPFLAGAGRNRLSLALFRQFVSR